MSDNEEGNIQLTLTIWEHRDPSMIALGNSGFSQRTIIWKASIFHYKNNNNLEVRHGVSSDSSTFIFLYEEHEMLFYKKKRDFLFLPKQQTPRPLGQNPLYKPPRHCLTSLQTPHLWVPRWPALQRTPGSVRFLSPQQQIRREERRVRWGST